MAETDNTSLSERVKGALIILKDQCMFSLLQLKLQGSDGGIGCGVSFSKASVHVSLPSVKTRQSYRFMDSFTEIFKTGNSILMDFVTNKKISKEVDSHLLDILLAFIRRSEDASKGLHGKDSERESEWSARLAVHLFLPLSMRKDFILDIHSMKKPKECPCSCKTDIRYGDTTIGNPDTWFGRLDIIIGKSMSEQEKRKRPRLEAEADVGATVVTEDSDDDLSDQDAADDELSQIKVKSDNLAGHLSQFVSQTIVFSFYQKKCNENLSFVPSIGINKNRIQFHFYDAENDIYLLSQEIPLFDAENHLILPTVIATWLVLNYKHLLTGPTTEMINDDKFGFHSKIPPGSLNLYKHEMKMGTPIQPKILEITNAVYQDYMIRKIATKEVDARYQQS
ncbi:uncharacterized protein LOC125656246 [Ostrea edulis]|uniref:uncharacterized protein LOC125656246 n=1 Tax=Ostrea edulis TaxID=37623 RepID=UPI0024AFA360|nr:uncharacterized protein LOC125656246 [Ostrea edulis]